ncbi:MAG: AAA domain-containing protein [Candidatus Lokiarchaeota archaeon]|nr:AAA domain-containing protein [Candidatus Lokiarchaeota archaeon]MBD3201158.1 AAA domain-containing protein [Candidatus Lokiarchaeota archaeon]
MTDISSGPKIPKRMGLLGSVANLGVGLGPLIVDKEDLPMNPRILGKPGVGKTTLAYATGKRLNKDVYIFQCTMDTRPEDLLISPVISSDKSIKYVASSLVSAMIKGGVCLLDEGNRISEKRK